MNVQANDDDFPEGLFYFYSTSTHSPEVTSTEPSAEIPPARVPLVIYIGEDRRIVGDAVVKVDEIEMFIDPKRGIILEDAITHGVIGHVSITFNAPPAIPVLDNGHVRWKKDY